MPHLCLIIERDPAVAAEIHRSFPPFGLKPCLVGSCEQAVAMLRQWRFDAVVLDADDLGAGCTQALRTLQARARVPLVLLASDPDEQQQIASLESGATEIVVKPASARLLAVKLAASSR